MRRYTPCGMSDADVDLRAPFPCETQLAPEVLDGLPRWARSLVPLDEARVRAWVAERWRGIPDALEPLAAALRTYTHPALVVGCREAYVELSADGPLPPVTWTPRPWLPTPWRFDPVEARRFLLDQGDDGALEADVDELEQLARESWAMELPVGEADHGDREPSCVFVQQPAPREQVERRLRALELSVGLELTTAFVAAFGGTRESEPGTAGGLWRADALGVTEFDVPDPAWRGAIELFHARNGDQVLLHPRTGQVSWHLLPEHRLDVRWQDVGAFARAYAAHLPSRWPFDAHGPPGPRRD